MSVTNGQKANQTTFNTAFWSRTSDTSTVAKVSLNKATGSGALIDDLQLGVNNLFDATGADESSDGTTYGAPDDTIDDGDTHEAALSKLAEKFDPATGHSHSGADGDGGLISGADIDDVALAPYWVKSAPVTTVTGTTFAVTAQLSGYTESTSSTVAGVPGSAPDNKVMLRQVGGARNGQPFLDINNREVYGRVTYSAPNWDLAFYYDDGGTETSYDFVVAVDMYFYFQQIESPMVTPPVYSPLADIVVNSGAGGSGGGGGGGGSIEWLEDVSSALVETLNFMSVYAFEQNADQALYTSVRVPAGYVAGSQIKLKTLIACNDAGNNLLPQTLTTLIRAGTDVYSDTSNQHTSTNAAAPVTGVDIPEEIILDLTDSSGEINSIAVSSGDLLILKFTRPADANTNKLYAFLKSAEVTFS